MALPPHAVQLCPRGADKVKVLKDMIFPLVRCLDTIDQLAWVGSIGVLRPTRSRCSKDTIFPLVRCLDMSKSIGWAGSMTNKVQGAEGHNRPAGVCFDLWYPLTCVLCVRPGKPSVAGSCSHLLSCPAPPAVREAGADHHLCADARDGPLAACCGE